MKMGREVLGAMSVAIALAMPQVDGKGETPAVLNTSYTSGGERILRHEVVLDATSEDAWKAFTTEEGWKSFAVPVVKFELKTGGKFHSNYKLGSKVGDPGTIYNTVLGYVPQRIIAFKIGLTEAFPAGPREAGTLFAVVEVEPVNGRKSRVVLSMLGWKDGADWDIVYKHFDWGNAYTLNELRERFISGPVNWEERARMNSQEEK